MLGGGLAGGDQQTYNDLVVPLLGLGVIIELCAADCVVAGLFWDVS